MANSFTSLNLKVITVVKLGLQFLLDFFLEEMVKFKYVVVYKLSKFYLQKKKKKK